MNLPSLVINSSISKWVIFSPKDLIIRPSSFSVTMPSLSPSNRLKHSLNSEKKNAHDNYYNKIKYKIRTNCKEQNPLESGTD